MEEKGLKQVVEVLKKLFIKVSLELNLLQVDEYEVKKLIKEIEYTISLVDPELGLKLKNANGA